MKRAFPALGLACLLGCGSGNNNAPTSGEILKLDSATYPCPVRNAAGNEEADIDQLDSNGNPESVVNGVGNATVTCTVSATSFNGQVCLGLQPCLNLTGSIPATATGCSTSAPCLITGVEGILTGEDKSGNIDSYSSSASAGKPCTLSVTSLSAGQFSGTLSCPMLPSVTAPQTYACNILSSSTFLFTNCASS